MTTVGNCINRQSKMFERSVYFQRAAPLSFDIVSEHLVRFSPFNEVLVDKASQSVLSPLLC